MRALLSSLIPNTFEDVAAVIALTGPGRWRRTGTTSTPTARTAGSRSRSTTPTSRRSSARPYGLMIYQEQLMRASQKLAGYSLEEADNLRKATGKKVRELIVEGAREVRRRLRPQRSHRRVRRALLRHDRAVRRLLVQQVAQRRLRLHHVPDRVAEGEPSGAVPRRVAHEREEQPRQGGGVPQRLPPARIDGARPRRERVGE